MKKLIPFFLGLISISAFSQTTQFKPTNPDSLRIPIQIQGVIRHVYVVDLLKNKADITALNNYLLSTTAASTYVAKVAGKGLSTEDYTTAEKTKLAAITGTNTGDETAATIKTKLGITTLSGSNTGDQDLSGLMVKSNNLSDITNVVTARTNLGLGSFATKNSLVIGDIPDLSSLYATQAQLSSVSGGGSSTLINDNLTTQTTGTALDAHQGYVLKGLIDANTTSISGKQAALNGIGYIKQSGSSSTYQPLIPIADGGTNSTSFTSGRVNYFNGTALTSSGLQWDNTNSWLGIGSTPTHSLTLPSTGTGIVLYNTADQTTNYERARLFWSSNTFNISSENGGTGTARNISISSPTTTINGVTAVNLQVGSATRLSIGVTSLVGSVNMGNYSSASAGSYIGSNPGMTANSGLQSNFVFFPTVNQTGTASYKVLWISPYEQGLGSGSKYLIDAGTNTAANGTGTHTSKFTVDNVGNVISTGTITGSNLSGTNTGDETSSTIKTKLGITTLSGSNTGDETAATIKTKLGITTLSGSNTGDQDLSGLATTAQLNAKVDKTTTISVNGANAQALSGNINLIVPTGGTGTSTVVPLTSSASMSWDFSVGNIATVTLSTNGLLSISNANDGDAGYLIVTQDATGGRTITLPDGTGFSVYTGANKTTTLGFVKVGGTFKWTGDYVLTTTGSGAASVTGNVINIPTNAGGSTPLTDNVTTQTTGTALDAHQGYVLKGLIDANTTNIATKAPISIAINSKTTSYTLVLGDAGSLIRLTNASANSVTVPPNSTVAFPIGTQITVSQTGAGQTSFVAGSGVVINSADGALKTRVQYSTVTLIKTATDTWLLSGDITN